MSILSNQDIPGFCRKDFRKFMAVIQRDWNLPDEFQAFADFYFLRHWKAEAICDNLSCDGITIDGVTYLPLFKRDSLEVYNEALQTKSQTMFWLSFRAVRYPLGSGSTHPWALKAYVLIQEDTRRN